MPAYGEVSVGNVRSHILHTTKSTSQGVSKRSQGFFSCHYEPVAVVRSKRFPVFVAEVVGHCRTRHFLLRMVRPR